jgi:hypothetical protein
MASSLPPASATPGDRKCADPAPNPLRPPLVPCRPRGFPRGFLAIEPQIALLHTPNYRPRTTDPELQTPKTSPYRPLPAAHGATGLDLARALFWGDGLVPGCMTGSVHTPGGRGQLAHNTELAAEFPVLGERPTMTEAFLANSATAPPTPRPGERSLPTYVYDLRHKDRWHRQRV